MSNSVCYQCPERAVRCHITCKRSREERGKNLKRYEDSVHQYCRTAGLDEAIKHKK